jgi:hypothetical protein
MAEQLQNLLQTRWLEMDTLGLMQQLGVVPTPAK